MSGNLSPWMGPEPGNRGFSMGSSVYAMRRKSIRAPICFFFSAAGSFCSNAWATRQVSHGGCLKALRSVRQGGECGNGPFFGGPRRKETAVGWFISFIPFLIPCLSHQQEDGPKEWGQNGVPCPLMPQGKPQMVGSGVRAPHNFFKGTH